MKKVLLVVIGVTLSLSSFAAPGDISVLHQGVDPDAISFKFYDIKYMILGDSISYDTDTYKMDIRDLKSKVIEAKRLGQVVDILKKEKSALPLSSDGIKIQLRPASPEEKQNTITVLRDQVLKLQKENSNLREALKNLNK
jgi:hypothetical protein